MKLTLTTFLIFLAGLGSQAQKVNDSTTPLHLMQPAYEIPYVKPAVKSITEVLDRVYNYLDQTTPMALINKETQAEVTDYSQVDEKTIFKPGDFRLVSYEWGVAYSGMLENVKPGKGQTIQKTVVVDVRMPKINTAEQIRLNDRELPYLNWDNKLTLEFNGDFPCVAGIEIERADELPTIFLAGNSTVTDQEYEPWASWGQMFPNFLKPEIVVANYAESGETLLAFKREKRLQKLLSQMKTGDYLFMEFAHNDQKPGGNHLDAFTSYKDELKSFIAEARKKGGKPVLVTSTNRRRFGENGEIINTLEDYPEAMRQTAREENVPLIDLNAMSKQFYEALGPENSKKAFVHYPANTYPGQDKPLADDTHFNPYGAYELAKCVAEGIRVSIPELAKYLRNELPVFNPSHPDALDQFHWPRSPSVKLLKPDGN